MKKVLFLGIFSTLLIVVPLHAFDFVILKYKNGDSYNARNGVQHFLTELGRRTTIETVLEPLELSLEDSAVFQHSFLFLNGHVPIYLTPKEKQNLKRYLENGGFLFANDDYGMDESFRKLITTLFPDNPIKEVPYTHEVYHTFYQFDNGIPKIHEHYDGKPYAYGLFINGRLAVFYTYNTDIADGWDDASVHQDPANKRESAIQMGVNIVVYALTR